MTYFRILIIIASFIVLSQASAATVSGEITTRSTPKTTITKNNTSQENCASYNDQDSGIYESSRKESMRFTIKHKNGIIVSISARAHATNKISRTLQNNFAKNISKAVVGKKMKNLDIDVVGGASLTTSAFEQFVRKII